MRNTTKLKHVLRYYDVDFSMRDNGTIDMTISDKETGEFEFFEHETYSKLVHWAFAFMRKMKKDPFEKHSDS